MARALARDLFIRNLKLGGWKRAMPASLIAAAVLATTCQPVPGETALFNRPQTRVIWVGEMHGTTEQPALFGDLVCAAADEGRPVVVVLERGQWEQPAWDAFLASDGGPAARAAFLRSGQWPGPQDGRCSLAWLTLAERLRVDIAAKRVVAVRMMIPAAAADVSPGDYEAAMAKSVATAAEMAPDALVLAYSGNMHAKRGTLTIGHETYQLANSYLPKSASISVVLKGNAGTTWNCEEDGCGPHAYAPSGGAHVRGVFFSSVPDGYDAVAYTGEPTTASPPAVPNALPAISKPPSS